MPFLNSKQVIFFVMDTKTIDTKTLKTREYRTLVPPTTFSISHFRRPDANTELVLNTTSPRRATRVVGGKFKMFADWSNDRVRSCTVVAGAEGRAADGRDARVLHTHGARQPVHRWFIAGKIAREDFRRYTAIIAVLPTHVHGNKARKRRGCRRRFPPPPGGKYKNAIRE